MQKAIGAGGAVQHIFVCSNRDWPVILCLVAYKAK